MGRSGEFQTEHWIEQKEEEAPLSMAALLPELREQYCRKLLTLLARQAGFVWEPPAGQNNS